MVRGLRVGHLAVGTSDRRDHESRTVKGHHGTSRQAAEAVLSVGFRISANPYDWLGDGAYFWQDAPLRAADWARANFGSDAAVIECDIELRDFINLLDVDWMSWLAEVHDQYLEELRRSGEPLPMQTPGAHRLDRAVINFGVSILEAGGMHVGGVIGAFQEGRPVFPNSALFSRNHVQIAVRDLSLITGSRILVMNEVPDVRTLEHR